MKFSFKVLMFSILTLSIAVKSNCQNILTKDGLSLGKRGDFISSCLKGANNAMVKYKDMEVQASKYCACLADNLIPTLDSKEIFKATKENKMKELFLNDKNFDIVVKCVEGNVKYSDDFKFGQSTDLEFQKKVFVKNCKNEIMQVNSNEIWTTDLAEKACNCVYDKFISEGSTLKEIKEMIDINSPMYNEVALPCVIKAFEKTNSKENNYNINDIIGTKYKSEINLVDYFGKGFKVKIKIGNVSKYFLFDTGASDLIIDGDTERELLLDGFLKRENYLNKSEYELADNNTIIGQKVKLNNIVIGDFTVNNVVLTIINKGSLLCGKSFLDKFRNWEIDEKNKILILYK